MARRRGATAVPMKVRSCGSASISAVCGLGTRTRSTSSALQRSAVMNSAKLAELRGDVAHGSSTARAAGRVMPSPFAFACSKM